MPTDLFRSHSNPTIRRLLILHSPKTGGSSLRTMLATHVAPARTSLSTGRHQWLDQSGADTIETELFVGHQFLEPLYRYPQDDWVTVLPVREPMSWWRSWYKWRRGLLQAADARDDTIAVLGMSEWVDGRSDSELSNPQASWLLARTRVMFDSVAARPGRIAGLGAELWRTPGDAVEVLGRLLDAVTVVGPTEDLQGIYLRACAAMGWAPRFEAAVRENTSRQADELLVLRPDQVERLRSLNLIDAWLHDLAVTRAAGPLPVAAPAVPVEPAPAEPTPAETAPVATDEPAATPA